MRTFLPSAMHGASKRQNDCMTESSLNLADKQELTLLAELVTDLRSVAPDIRVLLVGAVARDMLLFYAHGIRTFRATADIDLALAVADWNDFGMLLDSLLASGLFRSDSKVPHKLIHRQRVEVDLIPFGGVERPDGTIAWPPEGDTVMRVLGFHEASESSMTALLPLGQRVAVVSLSMLAVLKVLAWAERRTREPQKDASDLILILGNYLDAGQAERLFSEANYRSADGDFDYERAGSWLAGKDAVTLLRRHSANANRIEQAVQSTLGPEVDPEGPLRLIGELKNEDLERARRLLIAFLAGFSGEQYP
jgi:predicted nucleotidyltransferase